MPTFPEPVDDLDDLDLEDAFGHPVSGVPVGDDTASARDRAATGDGIDDDDGDVDDLDV
jgi:hypothetical protein